MMKRQAKLSVVVLLAMPLLLVGATLLERAMRLLPDMAVGLYLPLWLVLLIACPLCGVISIGYSIIHRGSPIRTAIGLAMGLLQIGVGVRLFIFMDRMITVIIQT